ncbi:hypothetical protein ES705_29980 [subsurface metagenome]
MMVKLNNAKFFRGDVILSNQDIGKKAAEENDLEPFLKEYERITNFPLKIIERTERPDFIVQRSDGTQLGIELTKVMRDPESTYWARVLNGEEQADPIDTAIHLQELIYRKDIKRSESNWKLSKRTVLLLQLMDSSIDQVVLFLDVQIIKEINKTGFFEIWIGDYSILEAYGTIQLYGIKPKKWRGLHDHLNSGKKPYG